MPPIEYVTPEGFRIDGRKPNEVCLLYVMGIFSPWLAQHRKVNIKFGVVPNCEASVEFSMGNTTAIAIVHGPRQVRRSLHSFLFLSLFFSFCKACRFAWRPRQSSCQRCFHCGALQYRRSNISFQFLKMIHFSFSFLLCSSFFFFFFLFCFILTMLLLSLPFFWIMNFQS